MISVNDLRTGITIEVDGEPYSVIEFMHVKPGKGAAFVRTKLRNLRSGNISDRTFRGGERVSRARVENREMQYLYNSGDEFYFMDTGSYEQITLERNQLGDAPDYMKENDTIIIQFYEGDPVGVDLPASVELEITYTEPGFKGDTATGGTKPATLETGKVIQVPLFIEPGTRVKVDTRSGEYISRV